MKKLLQFFGFNKKKPVCQHKRYAHRRYFSEDGTPMTYFHCFDCDYLDKGHVHGDPEKMKLDGWEQEITVGF